jgi:transposase
MEGGVVLRGGQRESLLDTYRSDTDPELRKRCHIVLLLAEGWSWADISSRILFCSTATIARWKARFEQGGVEALRENRRGRAARWRAELTAVIVGWVGSFSPRDFGFLRSRWTCSTVALLLVEVHKVRFSRETVRRRLHERQMVWRRPRPVVAKRKRDRKRKCILAALRQHLSNLADDETFVFQDEVDVNTNPEIGSMWMKRGRQATVETPGDNEKCYVAGSIHWRTGKVIAINGPKRDKHLFLAHLDDLRRRLRGYSKIHVILDNARFHRPDRCVAVREYLEKWKHRIQLHYLPTYSPDTNPMERVWWHLRNDVTRNHRCKTIEELLDLVFEWLEDENPFTIEGSTYKEKGAA